MRPSLFAALIALPLPIVAADIDRSIADFRTPAEIRWVRNPAGTNEQAILHGDPSKPGPYGVRIKWLPGNMIQAWGMGPRHRHAGGTQVS